MAFNNELSPQYEKEKMKAVGFTHPILKRSGQLLDSINPDGTAVRNIKILRKK